MAETRPTPVRLVTARGAKLTGVSATRQPGGPGPELWLLGALPPRFRVGPGDTFTPLAGADRKPRAVLTAVAAHGGGYTLTCSTT